MKLLFALTLFFGFSAMATSTIKIKQDLTTDDSISLQDENIHLGRNEQTIDTDGWITYTSSFSTSDGAFAINCSERNVMGSLAGQQCIAYLDSSISEAGITNIQKGAIENSLIVKIQSEGDVSILKSILAGIPFFQTSEIVSVSTPSDSQQYPRLRLLCDPSAKFCQVDLISK
jgi:hypothetical protein